MFYAKTHEQQRNILVVVVWSAMTGAVGSRLSSWGSVHKPVGLGHDEKVAAASREVAVGQSAARGALRGLAILRLVGAEDFCDSRLGWPSFRSAEQGLAVLHHLVVP